MELQKMSFVKLAASFVAGAGTTVAFLRYGKNSQWIKRGLTTEGSARNGTMVGTDTKITDTRFRDYLNQKGNREIKAFEEITKETKIRFPKEAIMVTDLAQLYFFRWLIPALNVKKAIEVGVFTGSSSLAIAKGLPKDGKLIAIDISDEYTKVARDFWKKEGVNGKVDLRIGKGIDKLKELTNNNSEIGTFDFAFIDAYKPEYKDYYELCLKLLKKNGIMCVDNTLWDNKVFDPSNQESNTIFIRQFNEMVKNDSRVDIALSSIGDGVTFIRKL
ncbi:expressed hypothetical protein [Reticulomyxa filosa]|uniref:O-methyltransferase n=1 Tax=Reticulomyxa filosa TaxID=46433 RepID=X6MSE1_RETFI|nr:expressed hypothetical protein [Reticulomyxa filosa]|eukprot:ETO16764.1 expressed hypothetical protein [Reticulomyxa filosa]